MQAIDTHSPLLHRFKLPHYKIRLEDTSPNGLRARFANSRCNSANALDHRDVDLEALGVVALIPPEVDPEVVTTTAEAIVALDHP